MKATVISYEPGSSDHVTFRIEGADSLADAVNFVIELDGTEDATVTGLEFNDDVATVSASGDISSEKFAVGTTFGITEDELRVMMEEEWAGGWLQNFNSYQYKERKGLVGIEADTIQAIYDEICHVYSEDHRGM